MTPIHLDLSPGDFLIFQLEAGFGLIRVLDIEPVGDDLVWHLTAYSDLFLDPEMADAAIDQAENLSIEIPHVALTNRAFESTQVAKMRNTPLATSDLAGYERWKMSEEKQVSDRSIRLLLGLR